MDIRQSVARLRSEDKKHWGTGFFVGTGNLLLTCFHVAETTQDAAGRVILEVVPPEVAGVAVKPVQLSAQVLADHSSASNEWDVALLELIGVVPEWVRPLPVMNTFAAYRGQQVHSYGFCSVRKEYGDPAVGEVVGLATDPASARQVIEIQSQQLTSGFSGAPIVDGEHNVVIGMMMSTLRQDQLARFSGHSWAVPASAFAGISKRIPLADHPLVSELMRLAAVRYPSLLDYALSTGSERVIMATRLQQAVSGETAQALSIEQVFERLGSAKCKVATLSGVSGSGKSTFMRSTLCKGLADRRLAPGERCVPLYLTATSLAQVSAGTVLEQLAQALIRDRSLHYPHHQLWPDLIRLMSQSDTRFVVLVDGLDEISNPLLRAETTQNLVALGQHLSTGEHWLIVASRPIDELKQFHSALNLEVCASTEEDTDGFFARLLGERMPVFLAQYRRLSAADLQGSPLLATLAVSLFLAQGTLPGSIAEIFREYVQLLVSRANGHATMGQLEVQELQEWEGVLQQLAYQSLMVEELTWSKALKILQMALPDSGSAVSRMVAKAQLESVTQSPLVLIREGDLLRWSHLSIREYLAGRFMVQGSRSAQAWEASLGYWRDPTFKGAVTFAILIRSAERPLDHQALSTILALNRSATDLDAVSFLCSLIELQASMEPQLFLDIINIAVVIGMREVGDFASCAKVFSDYSHPFDHLMTLARHHPVAAARIREIIDLPAVPAAAKRLLAKQLLNL